MMYELNTTTQLVRFILEKDEAARSSDNYLYLKVVQIIGSLRGIHAENMTLAEFLMDMGNLGFPAFETVRRTRQKIQREYPELAGAEAVKGFREAREDVFKEFARGHV